MDNSLRILTLKKIAIYQAFKVLGKLYELFEKQEVSLDEECGHQQAFIQALLVVAVFGKKIEFSDKSTSHLQDKRFCSWGSSRVWGRTP